MDPKDIIKNNNFQTTIRAGGNDLRLRGEGSGISFSTDNGKSDTFHINEDKVIVGSSIVPNKDAVYELGSTTKRFTKVHVSESFGVGDSGTFTTSSWLPKNDNTTDLGSSSLRFKDVFIAGAFSAAIGASDSSNTSILLKL